jgi:hypothetical protein
MYTDKSTMYGRVISVAGEWRKAAEEIGSLIACRMRQWYVMLCEAVLESIDQPWVEAREYVFSRHAWSKGLCANWPFGRLSTANLLAWEDFATKESNRRQNGMKT